MKRWAWVSASVPLVVAAAIACSSSSGASQCGLLDECCSSEQFPTALFSACNAQGLTHDETGCSAALQGYNAYCSGSGSAALPSAPCMMLAACCSGSLVSDSDVAQCYTAVGSGDATTCSAQMPSFCEGDIDTHPGDDAGTGDDTGTGEDTGIGDDAGGDFDAGCSYDSCVEGCGGDDNCIEDCQFC
jgi:hypothetical protein